MQKLRAEMTSYIKKEEYDVLNEKNEVVGYIQYSSGTLTCHPTVNGVVRRDIHVCWWQGGGIYDKNLPFDVRDEMIEKCLDKLSEYFNKK